MPVNMKDQFATVKQPPCRQQNSYNPTPRLPKVKLRAGLKCKISESFRLEYEMKKHIHLIIDSLGLYVMPNYQPGDQFITAGYKAR